MSRVMAEDWRSMGVLQLSYMTLHRVAAILDTPGPNNWKTILAMMPEYGLLEQQALERCGKSPSLAMFQEMASQGKTLGDLYHYADCAKLKMVCDLIKEGLAAQGIDTSSTETMPSAAVAGSVEQVSYSSLVEATDNFCSTELNDGGHHIGKGGFGDVYCCSLKMARGETLVAIKKLHTKSSTDQPLETELNILTQLDHPALLPLLGCSSDGPQLCLLYPFMSLRSLDRHLDSSVMTAYHRLSIALDISSGLQYLHKCCPSVLVHRDVKSANVLLEEGWKAKLADFGVVRSLSVDASTANTGTVVGTMVYMAPEYLMGVVSPGADIYALGVILMELLFGCQASDGPSGADTDLISYIEEYEDDLVQLYSIQWREKEGTSVLALANHCTHQSRTKRPDSDKVITKLTDIQRTILPP